MTKNLTIVLNEQAVMTNVSLTPAVAMMRLFFLNSFTFKRVAGSLPLSGHRTAVRGFTLLELLVVIAIIGLLAAYVGPKYFSQVGKSEVTVAKAQIESFAKALDNFRLDVGRYPTTEEGLNALLIKPASAAKWSGPYLRKEVPLDPWGHSFVYKQTDQGDISLISYGRDGKPGGVGADEDISY